jgi:uncharacterized protein
VNLFVPSRVSWSQNNTQCTLTQRTEYPRQSTTQFEFALAHPETFTVYVRIPAWAGAKTTLSVNGSRITAAIEPGKFLALKRAWEDRDRIEVEFDMPLRLEAIDDQDHDNVALMRGPLALFAVGEIPQRMARKHLLSASAVAQSSSDWIAQTDAGVLTLRPFSAIMSERYRLYNRVSA